MFDVTESSDHQMGTWGRKVEFSLEWIWRYVRAGLLLTFVLKRITVTEMVTEIGCEGVVTSGAASTEEVTRQFYG